MHVREVTQTSQNPRTGDPTGMEGGELGREADGTRGESSQRHASSTAYVCNNATTHGRKNSPPQEPTILPSKNGAAFGVKTHDIADQIEIKLAIEFPLKGGKKLTM